MRKGVEVQRSEAPDLTRTFRNLLRSPSIPVIGRRVLQAIPVLWGVTFLTFSLLNLLPGSAAQSLLGIGATKTEIAALSKRLGLDKPFFVRYGEWLGHIVTGHFGASLASGQAVSTIIGQRLPVTLELIGFAFFLALFFAIPVAVLAARWPRGFVDRVAMVISMLGLSVPAFVVGLILILIFAVHAGWFPAVGFTSLSQNVGQNLRSMVLPSVTLGFTLFATYSRVLRADILDQLSSEDYVVTAKAKGVSPGRVLVRHALRNSLFGLLTLVGLNLGALVGGTVLIEQIFALPGIGQELIQAISNRDIVVVQGIVVVLAVAVVLANLVTDLLYAVLDPRIRYGRPTN
jgi:peptide/nickel transport system permease protein